LKNAYQQLIDQFCALTGLPSAAGVAKGDPVDLNGITCAVSLREGSDEDFVVYADFGAMPQAREQEVGQALLEQNFAAVPKGHPVYGLSRVSRTVICTQSLSVKQTNAEALAVLMAAMAAHAKEWRSDYFLRQPGTADGSPATKGSTLSRLKATSVSA
jgi:Tir chaperone protein (CesT) family